MLSSKRRKNEKEWNIYISNKPDYPTEILLHSICWLGYMLFALRIGWCEFQHFTWSDIYDGFIIFINPSVLADFFFLTQASAVAYLFARLIFPISTTKTQKKTDYKIVYCKWWICYIYSQIGGKCVSFIRLLLFVIWKRPTTEKLW